VLRRFFSEQLARVEEALEAIRPGLLAEQEARQEAVGTKRRLELAIDWAAEEQALAEALGDALDLVLQTALEMMWERYARLGVRLSWEVWNRLAAEWAKRYRYDLIRDLTESTRQQLGRAISDWIERGDPFDALVARVRRVLPARRPPGTVRDRAQLIATTEVTRIYADAQLTAMQAAGLKRATWHTAADELVCPTCAPLNGVEGSIEGGFVHPDSGAVIKRPPAHPGCRCWWTESVAELEQLVGMTGGQAGAV